VIEIILPIVGLCVVLLLDLALIAARVSMLGASNIRILVLRDQMEAGVLRTMGLLAHLTRLKASLNLSLVLTRLGFAGLILLACFLWLEVVSPVAAGLVLFLAAIVLFWLEWAVETSVARNPELWALRLSGFVRLITILLALLLAPLRLSGEAQGDSELASVVTEDDLKNLVDAGQEEGVFELGERRMIYSIFQLGETLAREIMVPRIDMLALDAATPLPEAVDALLQSGYSRVPVYQDSVDNTLGLLYAKDLLRVWHEGGELGSMRGLLRQAYFVPEAKKVDELLAEMQSQRVHMAIVVDEYGGVAGLVTLEDIVEEILGEIQDEYDEGEEAPYQQLEDGEYLFLGRIDLDDFNDIMGSDLPVDEADTLGGLIYSRLGRVPTVGDKVREQDLLLVVDQVSARRIRKVRALRVRSDEQGREGIQSVVG
jgi:CBS domain containing-hemolysin-like protein